MAIDLSQLSDDALNTETKRVARIERMATARLLGLLIEVERRGVHLGLGYSSMFAYCTRALLLSEHGAYSRITAARTARRFPVVMRLLSDGALTLSTIGLLSPHLTEETADALLEASVHRSTRDVEKMLASACPQPDFPAQLRALPTHSTAAGPATAPLIDQAGDEASPASATKPQTVSPPAVATSPTAPRMVLAPIASKRYVLKLTVSEDTHNTLQRTRALLRHAIPDGDMDKILNRALTLLLDQVVRRKCGEARRPRRLTDATPRGRRIPAAIRRAVWERDQGRCVFPGQDGICGETAFLEFHHVVPFAAGGATDVSNLELRCRAHNAYEATVSFGADAGSARGRQPAQIGSILAP